MEVYGFVRGDKVSMKFKFQIEQHCENLKMKFRSKNDIIKQNIPSTKYIYFVKMQNPIDIMKAIETRLIDINLKLSSRQKNHKY